MQRIEANALLDWIMADARVSTPRPEHVIDAERLLDERGRDLGVGRVRVAFGRSGVAIGFPRDPMLHVSWWVLAVIAALASVRFASRRSVRS
jgi:hypothetical protein